MYHKGIRCTDCHDPHTTRLKAEGNQVCVSCHTHTPAKYDTSGHHFHPPGSDGSLCVECHMPETKYMVRDPRRDHGFTIPDPLLTKELGIPNARNRCHTNDTNTVDWAIEWPEKWYGDRMNRITRDRARRWRCASGRESMDCSNSASRVSFHNRCCRNTGEFTPAASTGAVIACARL